jgi:hypothetical protein
MEEAWSFGSAWTKLRARSCPNPIGLRMDGKKRGTLRGDAIEAWRNAAPFGESEERQGGPMGESDVLRGSA